MSYSASSEEKQYLDLSSVVLVVVGPRRHGRRRRGRRRRRGGRALVRGDRKGQRHGTPPAAGRARDDDVAVHPEAKRGLRRVLTEAADLERVLPPDDNVRSKRLPRLLFACKTRGATVVTVLN